jgi:phenylpropionate dioxygenase-like ring-hydroxylating dioxygenase large terminal subunit
MAAGARATAGEADRSASNEWVADAYPRYRGAATGFRNYWYPVMFSRSLGSKPVSVRILGERIMLIRQGGEAFALQDRCPHRGVPLSEGESHAPCTISCVYHGWTYDLRTGQLVAALTDSPDSPICGKASVAVAVYPVEERAGVVWVYVGNGDPPPVEIDIPSEFLRPGAVVAGRVGRKPGNWRFAAEAGIDEGHGRYLHRKTLFSLFREFPVWTRFHPDASAEGDWLVREVDSVTFHDHYEGVGRWPRKPAPFYRSRKRGPVDVAIRLPGVVRVRREDWIAFEYYVPVSHDERLELLLAVKHPRTRSSGWLFRLRYWLYIHWLYFGQFHGQDNWMIENMSIPPERLFRPDKAITTWRQLCEREVRSQSPSQWESQEGIVARLLNKVSASVPRDAARVVQGEERR